MEINKPPIKPADLVVVKNFGRGPQVFSNALEVLGPEANNALGLWQHYNGMGGEMIIGVIVKLQFGHEIFL